MMWVIDYLPIITFLCILLGVVFVFCLTSKSAKRFGVRPERVSREDAKKAVEMTISYLSHSLEGTNRHHLECKDAGCEGSLVMMDSEEILKAIKFIHESGGRLVLRKASDGDIENPRNTVLEVQKFLTQINIDRAKRMERKQKK